MKAFFIGIFLVVTMAPILAFGQAAPSITQQPQSQSALLATNTSFTISASGQTPLSYQWLLNGTSLANTSRISGATNATLNVSNVVAADAGSYQCVVTNRHGAVTSSAAILTVLIPASITSQPTNQVVLLNSNAVFSCAALGTAPLRFAWFLNGTPVSDGGRVSGSSTASLTISGAQTNDGGSYQVIVTNNYGTATSAAAILSVFEPAVILAGPTNESVMANSNAVFSCAASGSPPLQFAWLFNGTRLSDDAHVSGSSTPSLTISGAGSSDGGNYQVIVTNNYGAATSAAASLTVLVPASIAVQPTNQTVVFNGTVVIGATATGTGPLSYRWYLNGSAMADDGRVNGSASASLTISNANTNDGGIYQLVVTNSYGSATSAGASLVLVPVVGWGDNTYGQTRIPEAFTNAMTLSAQGYTVEYLEGGLKSDGTVAAWGYNYYNGGDHYFGQTNLPGGLNNLIAVSAGFRHGLALRNNGTVVGFGADDFGQIAIPAGLANVVDVSAGGLYSVALKSDGTVAAWGYNNDGEATPPAGLSNIVAIAAGVFHALAIRNDGTVVGWGANLYGEAVAPAGLSNVVAVAPGSHHSLALKADGTVVAWGYNYYGQSTVPSGLSSVIAVAAGFYQSLALKTDGTVVAWGNNDSGQATPPATLTNAVAIAGTVYHSVALVENPTVHVSPTIRWAGPANRVSAIGQSAVFLPTVNGSLPMTFQWYLGGAPLAGETNRWLMLSSIQEASTGDYTFVVSNKYGSATSGAMTLAVPPTISSQPASQNVLLNSNVTFTVDADGGLPLSYRWYFNGAPLSDGAQFSGATTRSLTIQNVQVANAGAYQVVVTNPWGTTTSSVAALNMASTRYVNVSSSNPVSPYTSWATAAVTIQDAVDAALDGDQILVTNGVYQTGGRVVYGALTNRVAITKAVIVQSVNGAAVTTIKGSPVFSSAVRCVYMTNGASLIGFTLSNGATRNAGDPITEQYGGGIYCESTNAFIRNCTLTGNSAYINAGGALGGTFDNCAFNGNKANQNSGGACEQATLNNCTLVNNSANSGGAAYFSTLNNCQLVGNFTVSGPAAASGGAAVLCNMTGCTLKYNSALTAAGGALFGTLNNCLVVSNSAPTEGGASGAELYNCTVVGNSATGFGAQSGGLSGGHAYNCIVVNNNGGNYAGTALTNCCTSPIADGGGNITNDPAFVDYANGNLRLQSSSPCINAGANNFVSGATDLDGAPRIVDGTVDMGAYEFQHVPVIVTQPTAQSAVVTSNAVFAVYSLGDSLTYQWQVNGTNLNNDAHFIGASSAALTISNVAGADAGSYQVIVSNVSGSVTSASATLTVFFFPTITSQPTDRAAVIGGSATFSTVVSGTAPFGYLWYSNATALANGARIAGATSATLSISNVGTNDAASYHVVVTNNYGSATSVAATLSVYAPAQIVAQPISQAVLVGSNVALDVTAIGTSLSYQWFHDGNALADGGRIVGVTTPALSISSVQADDVGGYTVVVTDVANVVTSRVASITVQSTAGPSTRYVDINSTNPVSPFLNWATAATNIQDAIDAAVDGDLVLVSNGVYQVGGRAVYGISTNRVTVDKAIVVQSVNGPAVTLIRGSFNPAFVSNGRCAYLTNGATLLGFTLTNGTSASRQNGDYHAEDGGGVWCESASAIVSNCVFVGNNAYQAGGGAFGGTLLNCLVTNNSAGMGGGVCSNIALNCVLTKNRASFQNASSGGGAYGSTLSTCFLIANTCNGGGAGASLSSLTSCVLSNNVGNFGGALSLGFANGCLISSNRAFNTGGGAYSNVLNNCIVKNNLGVFGGGASGSTIFNCTIVSNTASQTGGGVDGGTLKNCIIYHNFAPKVPDYPNDSRSTLNFCDAVSALATNGIGNITNEPAFVNLANGDFHLQSSSPCINSGNNAYVTNATDFDGNWRIVGNTVDIGAYEFQAPGSIISYAWLAKYGIATDGSADFSDADGDGLNNWQEWRAGTDPTDPSSALQLLSASSAGNGVTITWQSASGVSYFVQRATDLINGSSFSTIESNVSGQPGTTSFIDLTATNGTEFFYRVGVQ